VPVDNSPPVEGTRHRRDRTGFASGLHRQEFDDPDIFERRLYVLRKVISGRCARPKAGTSGFYMVSLSSRTIVYKGMFLAYQLGAYYKDLKDERFVSALALVHQRFLDQHLPVLGSCRIPTGWSPITARSTRCAATSTGWRPAGLGSSPLFGDDIEKLWPISYEGQSDTACFDNALEFLVHGRLFACPCGDDADPGSLGRQPLMDDKRRAFYEYHAALMEPWDGPAAVAFTDGRQIGATLDRNGLRPARYIVTDDDFVIMASEAGVLPVPEEKIVASGGCSRARCC
jgi:glutamate synthase (NADPH/NADH) large chain